MRLALRTRLRTMASDDVPEVMEIERESFPSMWPQTAYRRELQNKLARYVVLTEVRDDEQPASAPGGTGLFGAIRRVVGGDGGRTSNERLLGFIGVWLMVDEAHIVTVAVREEYRRMGIGERLLIACIELSMDHAQRAVTLEVRRSNEVAQRLYEKYGFDRIGLRVKYYTDNNEDAVLMATPDLGSPGYIERFQQLREDHQRRYPDLWA
jgi:ribosomal-protein-alanine N-acetyltransferase